MIECGEIDYEINRDVINTRLNEFFNIENLNETWVSALIKRIEVGETLTTEEGPKRDIFVTYTFKNQINSNIHANADCVFCFFLILT